MKIILTGGGTWGPVSPLIAIFERIKQQDPQAEFLWLGTKHGMEKKLIASYNISFKSVFSGKLRRYFSLHSFVDPFFILLGIVQSFFIILKYKPDVIVSAGGYVAVPVSLAGWLLRRSIIIHQQDVRPSLTNKILTPFANIITVTFATSLKDFPAKKTRLVGNPVRPDILTGDRAKGYEIFGLDPQKPTLLIMGGGMGSSTINELVIHSLDRLLQHCQIIHTTGGKIDRVAKPGYKSFDFLTDNLKYAYAIADLVVTRGGMASLTEIATLEKPSIIIPIPNSHQVDNATEFFKFNAAAVIDQRNLNHETFLNAISDLIQDNDELANYKRNVSRVIKPGAAKTIAQMILPIKQ